METIWNLLSSWDHITSWLTLAAILFGIIAFPVVWIAQLFRR